MTIHTDHPFADDEDDPARRFRGQVGGTVSLWTTGDEHSRAGLTVTSYLMANGDPARVIGIVDPESDLAEVLPQHRRWVVHLLEWHHRDLAETFAGLLPSPGGPFRAATWRSSDWGPVLDGARAWVGVCLAGEPREIGWGLLLEGMVDRVEVEPLTQPLLHRRGRYLTVP